MSVRGKTVPTSLEMRHASSMASPLLSRIDTLKKEVGPRTFLDERHSTNPSLR